MLATWFRSHAVGTLPRARNRYTIAVLLAGAGLLGTQLLNMQFAAPPYLLPVVAVVFSSLYGGVRAGLTTGLISVVFIDYLFLAPIGSIELLHAEEYLGLAVFTLVAVVTGSVMEGMQRAAADLFAEEKERRRQAEMVARAREDVLGVVAHDLRNPLNVIQSADEFLLLAEGSPQQRKRMVEMSVHAVKQMNRLIGDLLDAVRMQAGRLSLELAPVTCAAIVGSATETFATQAEERGIRLECRCVDDVVVIADLARVEQVVGNLIGNALKFTKPGGQVSFTVARNGNAALLAVRDTGAGIPAEHVSHLFDEFWQARIGDRRGAGLGLTIAKGIVEAHSGKIWVDSTPGSGSTFSFTLPTQKGKS